MATHAQDINLIDDFIAHFQRTHYLPPLTAKILTLLVLEGFETGLTFEQLLDKTGASKSSVSQSLNTLLEFEKIRFQTREGSRKKYFMPLKLNEILMQYQCNLEAQNQIMDKVICFRQQQNATVDACNHVLITKIFQEHIVKIGEVVADTISRIKEVEKSMEINDSQ